MNLRLCSGCVPTQKTSAPPILPLQQYTVSHTNLKDRQVASAFIAMTRPARFCLALLVASSQLSVCERRQASPPPRAKSTEAAGSTPAKVITRRISQAMSSLQVLDIMQAEQENPNMDLIAAARAWIRLAGLRRSGVTNHVFFPGFIGQTKRLLKKPSGQP